MKYVIGSNKRLCRFGDGPDHDSDPRDLGEFFLPLRDRGNCMNFYESSRN